MARILFPLSFAGSALVLVVLGLAGCGPKKTPEAAASPGTSMETAIQVCGPSGRRTYLARLTCPGEDPVGQATLSGSVGPRADGHPVDHLQVNCPDGTAHEIFMDMEHCEDADPLQEVGGLGVLPPPPPPELVPWEPGEGGIPMDAVARVPEQGVLLEVVDVGSEPRRVLRYTPVPGQQEQVRMRMLMAMEMTIAGNSGGRMMLPGGC